MVKTVVVENNQFVFLDDNLNLERTVDLPSLTHVQVGLYNDDDKRNIVDNIIRSLASSRGFFEGSETLYRRRIGDDFVYLIEGRDNEVGRIPLSDVSPVAVVKYVRLSFDEEKRALVSSTLVDILPMDCLVRPWREFTTRFGDVTCGVEVGLNKDYSLIVNF